MQLALEEPRREAEGSRVDANVLIVNLLCFRTKSSSSRMAATTTGTDQFGTQDARVLLIWTTWVARFLVTKAVAAKPHPALTTTTSSKMVAMTVVMTVATTDATMAISAEVASLTKWVSLSATCPTFKRTTGMPISPEPTATSNSMPLVATEVELGTAEAEVQAVTMPDLVTFQPRGAPKDQISW